MDMSMEELCAKLKQMVIDKIATELLKKLVYEETGKMDLNDVAMDFFDKFVTLRLGQDYSCRLTLHKKLIGIGAPVEAYLPAVAEKFGTQLLLPTHMEVGNAVGAITGSIMEVVEILIRPKPGLGVMDDPPCTMHSPMEKREFERYSEALDYAKEQASEIATKRAMEAGADSVEVLVENAAMRASMGKEWGGDVLIESKLIVTAVGKPRQFFEQRL
jgi:N-methylhydantoinase A/oxoprolinase/acetone carboxylase beta subunit